MCRAAAGLVDRPLPAGDEREHLTSDVALQASDRFCQRALNTP